MSKHRRACVTHQQQFFRDMVHHKSKDPTLNSDGVNNNSKAFHANLIYNRWKNNTKKSVFSNRLGISYQESIHARDVKSVLEYGKAGNSIFTSMQTGFQNKRAKHTRP
ncbi:hypothetical protein RhiirA4_476077 [Rhizophagus irregularis]|uniref:DUF8211 domain-containing protein n=1 Tax=Rhizophagus irregularis TaxID=588596 RepID=A0A2I1HB19_9GLOM|nr:hypothetical protein RhiirA4_476077 [Rhizophagus irregularis]